MHRGEPSSSAPAPPRSPGFLARLSQRRIPRGSTHTNTPQPPDPDSSTHAPPLLESASASGSNSNRRWKARASPTRIAKPRALPQAVRELSFRPHPAGATDAPAAATLLRLCPRQARSPQPPPPRSQILPRFAAVHNAQAQKPEVAHRARSRADVQRIARGYQHHAQVAGFCLCQQSTRQAAATGCVQYAQRFASTGISLRHCGQGFVLGGSALAGKNFAMSLLTGSTKMK